MTTQMKPGVTTFDTPNDTQLVVTRVANAPRQAVFECWTNPKYLPQWMLGPPGWTMPVCEIDLRPGGAWRYVWRKDDGSEMAMTGTVKEVHAPERLVTTERWGPEWPETVNSLVLTESGGMTTMTLTITYPSKAAREAATQTGMKEGMEASFTRFDRVAGSIA
jgi:uncharacterized protein YndB with AHSA1/START domain